MTVNGLKIAVLGAGVSGVETALFLQQRGAEVFVSEIKDGASCGDAVKKLSQSAIDHEFGQHTWPRIERSDFIVISPGIPPKSAIYKRAVESKIPVYSEIEVAFRFSKAEIVAVTGTSGKTTVTSLIREVLRAGGRQAVSCGNIGNSFIGEVGKLEAGSIAVIEVSSFQLMHIEEFRPHVAILLNVSDNHLDWHTSSEEYREAKWRIFKNQTARDFAIINLADTDAVRRSSSLRSRVVYFDGSLEGNPNFAVVEQVASLYRISPVVTHTVLKSFKGLEHRLEDVGEFAGVRYINDSKSTTVASLRWALERTTGPVILIAGGRYKGGDFRMVRDLIREKVKFVVTLGEAREIISSAVTDLLPTYQASSLEEAVRIARGAAHVNETVLFSPACSSFDMFSSYGERGDKFKEIVRTRRTENVPA